ncbi:MAG TPA: hypothetical protein VIX37_21155, partial [Candidatus Sulfotelmatobacter sp.]
TFSGNPGFPCYISPEMGEAGYQVNVLLPEGIESGEIEVVTRFRGTPLSPSFTVEVNRTSTSPAAFVSVADGDNLGWRNIRGDFLKATLENIEDPKAVVFLIDGDISNPAEFDCIDRVTSKYVFSLKLPPDTPDGNHLLRTLVGETELPPVSISIERLRAQSPAAVAKARSAEHPPS